MDSLHLGISPWTAYTTHVVMALLIVALLLAILFAGAVFVINFGMMSRREEDRHGGQEPSDIGFLQRERFKGARSHREYLPAEDEPEEHWKPEEESTVDEKFLLREADMPSDGPSRFTRQLKQRAQRRAG